MGWSETRIDKWRLQFQGPKTLALELQPLSFVFLGFCPSALAFTLF
ncbi:hypothetical protein SLEP1_g9560 [Rubroshorea leprosula]|uniref:Uncharacterized protein n=1 Tax=Rubroshorea leprosula TaxID=152421 RepID=A0AAV5IBA6_9ROSI|nr:hypothetical protein SLEP1_g9560 [Rubroshorea leprosula]